jgi:hypothetical protein
MSLLRHGEIYRPIVLRVVSRGGPRRTARGLIGTMSFQLAIPWRVALPQSPPPLRQPGRILQQREGAVQSKCSERQIVS